MSVCLHVVTKGACPASASVDILDDTVDETGLSLPEIAEALGISARTVQSWAQGTKRPNAWHYAGLVSLHRVAYAVSQAMPFNSPAQRRRWLLTSSADRAPSPLQLFQRGESQRLMALIETKAPTFGRQLLTVRRSA